jgi:undecaprenyl-diphosphatase
LIATPIILGAGVHELPKLMRMPAEANEFVQTAVIAGLVAGVTAFIAIWVLMRYFKGNDVKALDPFAWYCWLAGSCSLALLLF